MLHLLLYVVKRQLTICFKSSNTIQIGLCMLMSLSIHLHGLHLNDTQNYHSLSLQWLKRTSQMTVTFCQMLTVAHCGPSSPRQRDVKQVCVCDMISYIKCENEMAAIHLIKTFCLPTLMYGCEVWSISDNSLHTISSGERTGRRLLWSTTLLLPTLLSDSQVSISLVIRGL